jgi:hypothetical protein
MKVIVYMAYRCKNIRTVAPYGVLLTVWIYAFLVAKRYQGILEGTVTGRLHRQSPNEYN